MIQSEGLAGAQNDAGVRAAIFGPNGTVALAIRQWSGTTHQERIQHRVMLKGPEALAPLIWAVRRAGRPERRQAMTLCGALVFGAGLMAKARPCARRVLDVAGAERSNEELTVDRAHARGGSKGVTVNGLAIGEHELNVACYFRDELIRGPGAFVEVARRQVDDPAQPVERVEGTEDRSCARPGCNR